MAADQHTRTTAVYKTARMMYKMSRALKEQAQRPERGYSELKGDNYFRFAKDEQ